MSAKIKSNHEKFKKSSSKTLYSKFDTKKKKIDKTERASYLESISNNLNLPSDILIGSSIVTITGKERLCLENYKGIIEYTGDSIRIQSKNCRIQIEGKNLNIDYCTDLELHISGCIQGIYYC